MKFTEFKNGLNSGEEYSVYLFEGIDDFFLTRGLNLIKEEFLSEPEINFTRFDGDAEISDIVESLNGIPFMSAKRITAVKEFYPTEKVIKGSLSEYLNNPPTDSILVIQNSKSCDAIKKYKSVLVVDCGKADVSFIVKWIKVECETYNVKIDGETASKIAEYCLMDMTRISTETQKLISYVGSGEITKKDVDEMVYRDTEYKIYEMTDYIGKKNFDKALTTISEMLSRGETPQRILTSVYNYFRRLLHVTISNLEIQDIVKAFGIKSEYAVTILKAQAKLFSPRALKKAVDTLVDADYAVKSGIKDVDEQMWISIFKIMTEG